MTKRMTDIAITVSLVVLILQFMPLGYQQAHARDVKPDEVNKGTEVGSYDELWEAWKFVQPEGDDSLTGADNAFMLGVSKVFLKKGHYKNNDGDKWRDDRVRYNFVVVSSLDTRGGISMGTSITALPPVVSAWRVTGHIHGK